MKYLALASFIILYYFSFFFLLLEMITMLIAIFGFEPVKVIIIGLIMSFLILRYLLLCFARVFSIFYSIVSEKIINSYPFLVVIEIFHSSDYIIVIFSFVFLRNF